MPANTNIAKAWDHCKYPVRCCFLLARMLKRSQWIAMIWGNQFNDRETVCCCGPNARVFKDPVQSFSHWLFNNSKSIRTWLEKRFRGEWHERYASWSPPRAGHAVLTGAYAKNETAAYNYVLSFDSDAHTRNHFPPFFSTSIRVRARNWRKIV